MENHKTYFVTSDIHGFYDIFITELTKKGFDLANKTHILIVCGDPIDRGPDPFMVLKFILDLYKQGRAIIIRGNHEDLMDEMIEREYPMQHDAHNGTIQSACKLTGHDDREIGSWDLAVLDMANYNLWREYTRASIDYAEIGDYIFVHGWIPCEYTRYPKSFKFMEDWKQGDWSTARWMNGMEAWNSGIKIENKTIVCGHFHTSWGHSHLKGSCSEWGEDAIFDPFIEKGIIALDACTAHSKKINVLVIREDV